MKGTRVRVVIDVVREDWADPDVALPDYATAGAAGADLRANLPPGGPAGNAAGAGRAGAGADGLRVAIPRGSRCRSGRARGWR
jgi:dUTP pyrophosphatase